MKSVNVTLIVVVAAASLLFFPCVQAQQTTVSPFSGIDHAQQICGPKITPDSLQGKIVFVEYWGTRCGPCRQSMPHLQEMYSQLGKTGMFCIIGNHVQQYTTDTDKFLKDTGITFPVYQHLDLPINKTITSIPQAFLFDVNGKIVAEGHPLKIVDKIPDLVQEAILTKKAETLCKLDSSANLNDYKRTFTHSDLRNIQNTALAMSTPGKIWVENYKAFQKGTQSKDNYAAQTKSTTPNNSLNDEILKLVELSKTEPAKAYASIDKLNRSIKGMNQERALADIFKKLSADKNVKDLSTILMNIADFQSEAGQMNSTAAQNKAQGLFNSLKNYYSRKDLSKELKKEAYEAARELKEKYGCSDKTSK